MSDEIKEGRRRRRRRILVRKPEGSRQLRRHKSRREDNIKINFKRIWV
jgi:hypothetical protein